MTPQQAKELLPIITAFAEGKTIEFKSHKGIWSDCIRCELDFSNLPECYRIKPEPKLRPWKPEEVPVGAVVASCPSRSNRYVITAVWKGEVHLNGSPHACDDEKSPNINTIVGPVYHYTTDFGKTWLPCGVVE